MSRRSEQVVVTRADVDAAIAIAEIIGGVDAWDGNRSTLMCASARHCGTCSCNEECGHSGSAYECVADALGASDCAVDLYLSVMLALGAAEYDDEPGAEAEWLWAEGFCGDVVIDDDLEVAAILRDGELPPTYRLEDPRVDG